MPIGDVQPGDAILADKPVEVSRYRGFTRINHWVTAISLLALAISGLALFHPSFFALTGLFGGGQSTRMLHPWFGVVLLISFFVLFAQLWRANLWRRDDRAWVAHSKDVLEHHEDKLPEIGKYNAGQKVAFWSMAALILVLFATGLVSWQHYFGASTSIEMQRVAILVHAAASIGMVLVVIVHVYAAFWTRGTIRAMTRGTVTGGWAWRHHRKWLRALARDHQAGA